MMKTSFRLLLLTTTVLFSISACKKREPEGPGGDRRVKSVHARLWNSFALLENGEVLSWGRNGHGGLGNGHELGDVSKPGLVAGLKDVESLIVANSAAFARTKAGAWYAWGNKSALGEEVQGDGPTGVYSPIRVRDMGNVKLYGGIFDLFLAHDEGSGAVSGWGFNYDGQATGTPTRGETSAKMSPTSISLSGKAKLLAPADVYSIAVMADNTLRFWGSAAYGPGAHLNGNTGIVTLQPGLPEGRAIEQISAGHQHVLVVLEDGSLWAWGSNEQSQFGDSDLQLARHRTAVRLTAFPTKPIRQIAAGNGTVVLYEDGSVWRSGTVTNGRWDDFTPIEEPIIVNKAEAVKGLPPIAQISGTGSRHVLALATDGSVWAWGYNAFGQLGNGSTADAAEPVRVGEL